MTTLLLSLLACWPMAEPSPGTADDGANVTRATGLEFAVLESLVRRTIASGSSTRYGLKIDRVAPHSSAAVTGLRKGDLLMKFDGNPVRNLRQLNTWINEREPGSHAKVEISRKRRVSLLSRRPWKTLELELQIYREESL